MMTATGLSVSLREPILLTIVVFFVDEEMLFQRIIFLALSFPAWAFPAFAQSVDPSCFGPDIVAGVVCPGETVDPLQATTTPAAYAWKVFAEINQPAFPGNAVDNR